MAVQIFPSILALFCCCFIVNTTNILLPEDQFESLACKMYDGSKLDCSRRNLHNIPILDKNWTTELDLSYNELTEIKGSPFRNLTVLTHLYLRNNKIAELNSTAFKGLKSLIELDLHINKLLYLPSGLFDDLGNLQTLDLYNNKLLYIPAQILTDLHFLTEFSLFYDRHSSMDGLLRDFDAATSLCVFSVLTSAVTVTNATFKPLHGVKKFSWLCYPVPVKCFADKTSFEPFLSLTQLQITFDLLPALGSLHSPLQELTLASVLESHTYSIDNTTFQGLVNIQESLTVLQLLVLQLSQIKNDAFIWMPNLIVLTVKNCQLNTIERHGFRGLSALEILNLSDNALTAIPSVRLSPLISLKHLDLSSNMISAIEEYAFASVLTLNELNIISNKIRSSSYMNTTWLYSLQRLNLLKIGYIYALLNTVEFNLPAPVFSLNILELKRLDFHMGKDTLCSTFPNITDLILSNVKIYNFPGSLALHECYVLNHLDLSGSAKQIIALNPKDTKITIPSLKILVLAQNELDSIKQILAIEAPHLASLNLSDNNIRTIDISKENAIRNLTYFFIDGNGLESLSGLEHLTSLKHLNAARNQLKNVPLWLLSPSGRPALVSLDLSNNPFSCICEMEGFKNNEFRKWILSDTTTRLEPDQYICAFPGKFEGLSVSQVELDCRSYTSFYIGISIPFIILFVMIIIFFIRYRWHIKYKLFLLYRHYHPFPDVDEEFEMLQLQYNAYIAYNEMSDDENWVYESLQPNLEGGPEQVKLCIKTRDFIPGRNEIENITESIQLSHKTILVLSPNFVKSNLCRVEVEIAQMRLTEENLDVLILISLHDIPENKITLPLCKLLCKKELIKWPKDRAGEGLFWQRVREELKAPAQMDHRYCMK